jgi:hypothetical protein
MGERATSAFVSGPKWLESEMHERVWRWRRLGFRCAACGLAWPRRVRRCIDAPSPMTGQATASVNVRAETAGLDWNGPTLLMPDLFLTRAGWWRGNGGSSR